MFQVGPDLAYISLISTSLHLGLIACTYLTYISLTSIFQTISAPRSLCIYISHLISLTSTSQTLSDICLSNPLYISVSTCTYLTYIFLTSASQTRSTSTSQTVSTSGSLSPCTYLTYISLTSTSQIRSTSRSLYMYISHIHLSDIYISNPLYICISNRLYISVSLHAHFSLTSL